MPAHQARLEMNKAREVLFVVLLIAVTAIPRFVGLGRFTSIDEPFWLRVSGNFYYALGQRQFENTLYEYHPAVTTMWIISAGMLGYFPEYRSLDQGYLKPNKFDAFMLEHGKSLLQLLIVSRAIQVVVIIGLLVGVYFLLRALFGSWTSFFTTTLISISPFFLGHSRLLNHEAMLALFLVISLLAMLVYMYVERRLFLLILSGTAAALGQLTKSSGIVLFPVIALAILIATMGWHERKLGPALLETLKIFGIWMAATAAAYVLFWPGMWVAPGEMLSEVYGNALTYVFAGARLSATPDVTAGSLPASAVRLGLQTYLSDAVWRTTPLTLFGFLLGIGLALARLAGETQRRFALVTLYATILGLLILVLFSVQRGPKPPHYTMTTYVSMDLIAGLGWSRAVRLMSERSLQTRMAWMSGAALPVILALQLISAIGFYPYYITYYDPLVEALRPGMQNPALKETGYGVGLDQAAAYLAQKPDAKDMLVMSANGLGSFSYYFPGRSAAMNYFTLSDPLVVTILKDSQYVVVDYYNQKRHRELADLKGIEPEKVIWLNGIDFLRIYRAADLLARLPAAQP